MATSKKYTMMFGDGNNSDGTPKYLKVSLGSLNPEEYDATKVKNLVAGVAGLGDYEFQFGQLTTVEEVRY